MSGHFTLFKFYHIFETVFRKGFAYSWNVEKKKIKKTFFTISREIEYFSKTITKIGSELIL